MNSTKSNNFVFYDNVFLALIKQLYMLIKGKKKKSSMKANLNNTMKPNYQTIQNWRAKLKKNNLKKTMKKKIWLNLG
jgi:hypothetical protein